MTWWPGWDSIASTGWWSHFWFWFGIACLFALGGAEVVSHIYGLRKDELVAAAERAATTQREADADAAETRRKAEVDALQKQLTDADKRVAELRAYQAQRHISPEQKAELIRRLSPFQGTKIWVVSLAGNDDSEEFRKDFEEVFAKANWEWSAAAGMLSPTPIGVWIQVNKAEAMAKRTPVAEILVNALIEMKIMARPTPDKLPVIISEDQDKDSFQLIIGTRPRPQ
jgi:hypothetical protein